ncbi:transporter substrate-binding domain-containing protein [Candidatus Gracilibacteria bacterium]|nr:transporter substrate-binding domain-containing protein [Candidatus Gracilibacteria bacterium]
MTRPQPSGPPRLVLVFTLLSVLLAACGQAAPGAAPATAPTEAAATAPTAAEEASSDSDLLADVRSRGTLVISSDPNYAPQSFKNSDGSWEGFDIDVGREIAKRLGVEAEFVDISFDVITAGSWNGRWDINVGSMTVTGPRQEVLYFSAPYYYAPAAFVVHQDSTAAAVSDLAGKNIGVGAATTYLDYLNNSLTLEGEEIAVPAPEGATSTVYDTDLLAIEDLKLGDGTRLDAVLTALPTAQNAINEGAPLKILGDPVFFEQLAVALDRQSPLDSQALATEISTIIEAMRADGTLKALSEQYYTVDLTSK